MSKEKKSGLGKFVAGAAIGAGLGILFAPRKGSETRAILKAKMNDLVEQIKHIDIEEVVVKDLMIGMVFDSQFQIPYQTLKQRPDESDPTAQK